MRDCSSPFPTAMSPCTHQSHAALWDLSLAEASWVPQIIVQKAKGFSSYQDCNIALLLSPQALDEVILLIKHPSSSQILLPSERSGLIPAHPVSLLSPPQPSAS